MYDFNLLFLSILKNRRFQVLRLELFIGSGDTSLNSQVALYKKIAINTSMSRKTCNF